MSFQFTLEKYIQYTLYKRYKFGLVIGDPTGIFNKTSKLTFADKKKNNTLLLGEIH